MLPSPGSLSPADVGHRSGPDLWRGARLRRRAGAPAEHPARARVGRRTALDGPSALDGQPATRRRPRPSTGRRATASRVPGRPPTGCPLPTGAGRGSEPSGWPARDDQSGDVRPRMTHWAGSPHPRTTRPRMSRPPRLLTGPRRSRPSPVGAHGASPALPKAKPDYPRRRGRSGRRRRMRTRWPAEVGR